MSGLGGAVAALLRCVTATIATGTGAVLLLSLLTTYPSASTVVLTTLLVAIAATASSRCLPVTTPGLRLGLPRRYPDEIAMLRAGRVTDSLRHPLRPRAPGLV